MPNHVHLLISVNANNSGDSDGSQRTATPTNAVIPRIIHGMKATATKHFGFPIWQRSFYDRIIRNESEYHKIREYIESNPDKWEYDTE